MEEFDKKLKQNGIEAGYENTRKSYKTFYRSAAVVPIKADMSIRFYHAEKADDIIGFLCADSKRVDVFTTDRAKVVLELMESYALLIYEVMNDYRYYLGKDISAVSRCNACEHDFKAREADCPSVSEAKKANPKTNRRRRKK